MSLDLHLYLPSAFDSETFRRAVEEADLRAAGGLDGSGASFAIERRHRGSFEYLATVDGPFAVEPEDLPHVVSTSTLGVEVVYHVSVEGSSQAAFKVARTLVRKVVDESAGVVYDPQADAIDWPRGSRRSFEPPPEPVIDVVNFTWYIRRVDAPDPIAAVFLEQVQKLLPEAMPRRFGSYEPFQHKLADVGPDGFVEAWNQESSMLFWKGSSRPCFGGSSSGLGLERSWPKSRGEAVGSIGLTLDGRAFEDPAWRRQLVAAFEAVAVATGSFAAVADTTGGVRLSRGGSLSYRADTVSPWGLVARGEWLGLPEKQPWLLWLNAQYNDFIGLGGAGGALLLKRADTPIDPRPEGRRLPFGRNRRVGEVYPVPEAARLRSTGPPGQGGERIRAAEVPNWL